MPRTNRTLDLGTRRLRAVGLALGLAALAALVGCKATEYVSLREQPRNPLADQLMLFAKGGPRPTQRTQLLLRRYALDDSPGGDVGKLSQQVRQVVEREPSAENVYALAELSYLGAKKIEATEPQRALQLHSAAAMHAYRYLFDEHYASTRNPYDPQFRAACDLYNGALEGMLRIVRRQGGLAPGASGTIPIADQTLTLEVALRAKGWQAQDIERFEFASDYEIKGLQNHYHTYGLGVPLIAVCKNKSGPQAMARYYPPGLCFPVTAFLRMAADDPAATSRHTAVLDLFDPLEASDVVLAGRRVPLETDLSTSLAYLLGNSKIKDLDLATYGLIKPEESAKLRGLYMIEPYRPDKVPVLMVHGLWSTPITWMEMFNDLRGAADVRSRYQFWFYLYPTGQPFWYSAAQLREDLAAMRESVDPGRQNPRLDAMVLVGHSMGGLVSKLQTIDSGNDFWSVVSERPFESVKAAPEIKQALARTFFFQANSSVRRVITIGTPHRGSNFANSTTRYLGSKLIRLPMLLTSTRSQLERDNPGLFRRPEIIDVPTSIDSLSPKSAFWPVLLAAERPPRLHYHNIIGRVEEENLLARAVGLGKDGGSDGVVPIASAHLDGVDSEIVVPADHSTVHRHPQSVLEVRRILLEHLTELDGGRRSPLEQPPWTADRQPAGIGWSDPRGARAAALLAPAE